MCEKSVRHIFKRSEGGGVKIRGLALSFKVGREEGGVSSHAVTYIREFILDNPHVRRTYYTLI